MVGLYQIPSWLVTITISANFVYGIGASLLASWHQRPIGAVSADFIEMAVDDELYLGVTGFTPLE